MKPFSFIHAADLHLDTPFVGIGRVSPGLQERLRDASLLAFRNLVRAAIERKVSFVAIAGDIYDGAERGTRAQIRFLDGLRELHRHGIQCFFIHGNHDPVDEGWSALRRDDFPAGTVLFDQSDAVCSAPVYQDGELVAVVHGISFGVRHETRNLSRLFPTGRSEAPFHIGLLHCNVGGQAGHDNYAPCSIEDLCSRTIDYWALGHIHRALELRQIAPSIHYPGNLQARSFNERGQRGATLVHVSARNCIRLESLALDEVRFAEIAIDTKGCDSLDRVFGRSEEKIRAASAENDGRFLVVRVRLYGQTLARPTLLHAAASDDNGLLSSLRDRMAADNVWLDSIRVATIPVIDRQHLSHAAGFEAALVNQSDEWLGSEEKLVQVLADVQKPLLTGSRLRDFMQEPEAVYARELLNEAEAQLLGVLQPDERP